MTKQTAHIDDWEVLNHPSGCRVLVGCISAHPRQEIFRTARQQTSKLLSLDDANGTAETLNTIYTLGAPRVEA